VALSSLLQCPDDQLRIPVLRTIGNLVCGANEIVDIILAQPLALQTLYTLLQAEHKGLLKETCWTISNIAAGSPQHRLALMQGNFPPLLLHILQNCHFDIRKEAGIALFHLLMDPACREHVLTPELAFEYVSLLRAPDLQVVDVALRVIEIVLAEVPGGAKVVEEADGIDALEQLVYKNAAEGLVERASHLVDKYYGEDAEPY
jgi:importin subunit alpha-1